MRLRNDFRRDARVHDWKHFSSSHKTAKQRRFFSRMEHQTFDKNLNRLKFSTRVISRVYCSMDILVTRECEIENIFPHFSTWQSKEQLWPAWNIKLLAKTWNRPKFSHHVISMVYYKFQIIWDFWVFLKKLRGFLTFEKTRSLSINNESATKTRGFLFDLLGSMNCLHEKTLRVFSKRLRTESFVSKDLKFVVLFYVHRLDPKISKKLHEKKSCWIHQNI